MTEEPKGIAVIPVSKEMVDLVWDEVSGMLEKATFTAAGKCDIQDVRDGIESGVYLLWVAMDGAEVLAGMTTRIIEYPKCRALALDWIGGIRMREWITPFNEQMVLHAKNNGCVHLEGYGRPAWLRWTRRFGWKEEYVAFKLEVRDGQGPKPVCDDNRHPAEDSREV
jgi:hypothetical protein